MATYRVYIRRPGTKAPLVDWMQTVVAKNSSTAIAYAYANWVNSNPTPPPPPLSQCDAQAVQKAMAAALLGSSAVSASQQAFIDDIQNQVSKLLATQLDGAFHVVIYPSGFDYRITYGNNAYYNRATLQDIDTLLGVTSDGQMDLTGRGFLQPLLTNHAGRHVHVLAGRTRRR